MKNVNEIIEELNLDNQLRIEALPSVALYMDQVIQLFENTYKDTLRNDSEKVLTKTMINNYAKGKLLFPIENKKYTDEHLMLISLIYQLKGVLSINDIKQSLDEINEKVIHEDEFSLVELYQTYLSLVEENIKEFTQEIPIHVTHVQEKMNELEGIHLKSMENFLLMTSFVHMSNMYRKMAEKLVDEIKQG